jgi:hypothetical protein
MMVSAMDTRKLDVYIRGYCFSRVALFYGTFENGCWVHRSVLICRREVHYYSQDTPHLHSPQPFISIFLYHRINTKAKSTPDLHHGFSFQINQPTTYSRVLLEILVVVEVVKEFPSFYGIQKFIVELRRVCNISLYLEPDKSNPHSHIEFI